MIPLARLDPVRTTRRAALQIGVGLFGVNLPEALRAAQSAARKATDVSCIFIFLAGGPSQFETFDPKPEAPVEVRGLLKPTQTNVPGTLICEKLPLMAQRMDKVAVIRSWQGTSGGHDIGSQHVASGFLPMRGEQYFPNFGCLISALRGNKVKGIPAHFGLPVAARYTDPPGYLGAAYEPFNVKGDPRAPELQFSKLSVGANRFEDRRSLLTQLDNLDKLAELGAGPYEAHDKFG